MKISSYEKAFLGIIAEIAYTAAILLAAFLVCLAFYFKI
jgi:hypothetical protein